MVEIGQALEALLVKRSLEEYRSPNRPVRLTTAFPHGLEAVTGLLCYVSNVNKASLLKIVLLPLSNC